MHERIEFQSASGTPLVGVLSTSAVRASTVIIYTHGFTSSKETPVARALETRFANLGIDFFCFDFFGHGESGGAFADITLTEGVNDILAAVSLLRQRGYNHIGLIGSSFGGNCALLAAAKLPDLFAVALKAPVANYAERELRLRGETAIAEWKAAGYREHYEASGKLHGHLNYAYFADMLKNDGYEAARSVRAPVCIVHGTADTLAYYDMTQKLATLIPQCVLHPIMGAGHHFSLPHEREELLTTIVNFMVANQKKAS